MFPSLLGFRIGIFCPSMRSELDNSVQLTPAVEDVQRYISYYDKFKGTMAGGRRALATEEVAPVQTVARGRSRIEILKDQIFQKNAETYKDAARMNEVAEVCRQKEIVVIEDAKQKETEKEEVCLLATKAEADKTTANKVATNTLITSKVEENPSGLFSESEKKPDLQLKYEIEAEDPIEKKESPEIKEDSTLDNSSVGNKEDSSHDSTAKQESDDVSLATGNISDFSAFCGNSKGGGLIEDEDLLSDADLTEFYTKMMQKKSTIVEKEPVSSELDVEGTGDSYSLDDLSIDKKCPPRSEPSACLENAPSILSSRSTVVEPATIPLSVPARPMRIGSEIAEDFDLCETRPFLLKCAELSFSASKVSKNLLVSCPSKAANRLSQPRVLSPIFSKAHLASRPHAFRVPGFVVADRPSFSIHGSIITEEGTLHYIMVSLASDESAGSLPASMHSWFICKDLSKVFPNISGSSAITAKIAEMDDATYNAFIVSDVVSEVHRRSGFLLHAGKRMALKIIGRTLSACLDGKIHSFVRLPGASIERIDKNRFAVAGMTFECSCEREREAWFDAIVEEISML